MSKTLIDLQELLEERLNMEKIKLLLVKIEHARFRLDANKEANYRIQLEKLLVNIQTDTELESIKKYWDAIPDDVNILVTHGPPKGILDMTTGGEQVGCEDLLHRIWSLKNLKLCQFGHIHEHAGYEFINGIHFINASVLNFRYQLQNKPLIFEVDENKNITKL